MPLNPYVAGNPVGDSPAFIGRAATLMGVTASVSAASSPAGGPNVRRTR